MALRGVGGQANLPPDDRTEDVAPQAKAADHPEWKGGVAGPREQASWLRFQREGHQKQGAAYLGGAAAMMWMGKILALGLAAPAATVFGVAGMAVGLLAVFAGTAELSEASYLGRAAIAADREAEKAESPKAS